MIRFGLVIGAMKAGTTSLFAYLSQHPEIAPCREKEPEFFSNHFDRGLPWYLSLWDRENRRGMVLLEASTNYTKYPSCPEASENMVRFARDHEVSLKLIYVLRHPVERIESHHTYAHAHWKNQTLGDAIGPHSHLVNVSRYARQLDRYMDRFDRSDLLLLDFADLTGDTARVLAKVCVFLGIGDAFPFNDLDRPHNESEGARIVRPLERVSLRHPRLQRAVKTIPAPVRHGVRNLLFRERIRAKFKLTPTEEANVRDLLQDDMSRLRDEYGIDVAKWGF